MKLTATTIFLAQIRRDAVCRSEFLGSALLQISYHGNTSWFLLHDQMTGCAVSQALCWRRHIIPMGASREFDFFPTALEVRPQPIFTRNGSNDVDSRKDVPIAVKKSLLFIPPGLQGPKRSKVGKFLDFNIRLEVREREHHLFFIGAQWKWHSE